MACQGRHDIKAAAHGLSATPPFSADAVFHAQQATEKVLKGYLTWRDIPFRKTHDLAELGRKCADIEPALETLLHCAASLTKYAWMFRYPGEPEQPSCEEAIEALSVAREVYEAILACLPEVL